VRSFALHAGKATLCHKGILDGRKAWCA